MQFGLLKDKSFTVYGQTINIGFWAVGPFKADPLNYRLDLDLLGYTDRATFLANRKNFYPAATIRFVFQLTAPTWPFAPGVNLAVACYDLIQTRSAITDDEGNELNGGLDWSTATDDVV